MTRSVRILLAGAVVLLLPACLMTYYDPGSPLPPGSSGPPFMLTLPIEGDQQAPTNPEFAWNALDGAIRYELQVSTAQDFSQIVWDDPTLTSTSTFLVQVTLTNFTTYFWRIYGIEPDGSMVVADGSPGQFRTQGGGSSTPASFATQNPFAGETQIALTPLLEWQPSMGAISYTVEIDPAGTFSPPLVVQSNIYVNRVTLGTSLSPSTTYAWRVLATGVVTNTYSKLPAATFTTGP